MYWGPVGQQPLESAGYCEIFQVIVVVIFIFIVINIVIITGFYIATVCSAFPCREACLMSKVTFFIPDS